MTELLTDKANNGNLTECDAEKLEVLEKIKSVAFSGAAWPEKKRRNVSKVS
jgi:hypothetical protein